MLVTERMQALGDHAKSSQQPPLRERRPASKDAGMPKQVAIDESVSEVVAAQLPIARKDDESATKRAIIHEWENWSALHTDELGDVNVGKYFFEHLQNKKSHLLGFASDDGWATVRGWLVQASRISG